MIIDDDFDNLPYYDRYQSDKSKSVLHETREENIENLGKRKSDNLKSGRAKKKK